MRFANKFIALAMAFFVALPLAMASSAKPSSAAEGLSLVYKLGDDIAGALTETNLEDWYKIEITSSGYYTQVISAYCPGLYWTIYNWDLSKEVDQSDSYSSGSEAAPETIKHDVFLSEGTYYVMIEGEKFETNK